MDQSHDFHLLIGIVVHFQSTATDCHLTVFRLYDDTVIIIGENALIVFEHQGTSSGHSDDHYAAGNVLWQLQTFGKPVFFFLSVG